VTSRARSERGLLVSDAHGIAFGPREIEIKIEVDAARRRRSVEGTSARRASQQS
jgi:hypothetical protein